MLYLIVIIHGYFFLDKPSPNEYNQTCVTKWVTKVRTRCGSVWLEHLVWDQGVAGSNPVTSINFICRCGSMVEHQPSKLNTWVRFPSPALQNTLRINLRVFCKQARPRTQGSVSPAGSVGSQTCRPPDDARPITCSTLQAMPKGKRREPMQVYLREVLFFCPLIARQRVHEIGTQCL